ncbi:prolipoprotein diacylglyceryl transferase [Mycolicibacterium baixiangningiae]|uniref:prolipoprotein diacylglyceryl transferase n=1 Tax=Mycolicibacterium baixiangningiae TaxID=2761578 RepID=UPI001868AF7F|nr:prolipoprotein diacylglyceryl transferase [Mycolicibacterium baixiangningiae]
MTSTTLAYIPSPSQGVWELGPFPLRAYALCIIVGIIVALVLGDRRWEARGGEAGVVYDIALWAVPFGLIGGRLYHVITDWQTYFGPDGAGLLAAFRIWEGGLGIWGAVALGGVGAWIACRRRGIPLPAFGDAVAPGIILAQAIGRLGNYFNQELYGRPTTLPWGLEIYERVDASGARNDLIGVSTGRVVEVVHPTFLYELLWNLLVFAVLIWADRRFKLGHGRLFALYVAGYCLGRFWIELLRSDMATHLAGIRVNSFTSMFVFIGAVVYLMAAPRGREDPATLREEPTEDVDAEDRVTEDGEPEDVKPEGDEPRDSATEELLKHLVAGVAVTSGLGMAANVAGAADEKDDSEAGEAADREPLTTVGAVEGEDAVAAEESAEEAHEAAVEGAEEAAAVADEVAADVDEPVGADGPLTTVGAVEGEDAVAAEESAEEAHEAAVEGAEEAAAVADEAAADVDEPVEAVEPLTTVGVVEGEDAVAAEESAEEAHEAAVEAREEAEAVAEEAAVDETGDEGKLEALAEDVESAPSEDIGGAADRGPLTTAGAVQGEDAVAVREAAEEAHEAAVERAEEAEAVAAEVSDDVDEPAGAVEPLTTVGAVEGEDAVAVEEAAEEAHEAAVEAREEAEAVAEEAAADETADEGKPEPVAEAEALAEDVESAPSEDIGEAADREPLTTVGAVEGEDAVAVEDAAEEAHEAAVEAREEAEAVAEEAAADVDEPAEAVEAVEPLTTAGALEGEDAVAAEEAAEEAHEAAVERAEEAEAVAEDAADAVTNDAETTDYGDLEAAVERAEEAEAVAEDIAAADAAGEFTDEAPGEAVVDTDTAATPSTKAGAVEGDEAAEAVESAKETRQSAVTRAEQAQAVARQVASTAAATLRRRLRGRRK